MENSTDFIVHFQWLQEKQFIVFVRWKWIAVNVFLDIYIIFPHALFSYTHLYAPFICILVLSGKNSTFFFPLKFIINNLYCSQKLHMLSIYRQEYNFGKYTIDEKLFFLCMENIWLLRAISSWKKRKGQDSLLNIFTFCSFIESKLFKFFQNLVFLPHLFWRHLFTDFPLKLLSADFLFGVFICHRGRGGGTESICWWVNNYVSVVIMP